MQQLVHKPSHCIATLLTCSISGLLIYSFTFTSTPYTYNPYTHTQALTPTLRLLHLQTNYQTRQLQNRSFNHSSLCLHSVVHSPTHSPTHSLTHPPTHAPTHSLTLTQLIQSLDHKDFRETSVCPREEQVLQGDICM